MLAQFLQMSGSSSFHQCADVMITTESPLIDGLGLLSLGWKLRPSFVPGSLTLYLFFHSDALRWG